MQQVTQWFGGAILEAANEFGLDPKLVAAVVSVESSGLANAYRYEPGFWLRYLEGSPTYAHANPRRVSASYGLMQIMYTTACEVGYVGAPEGLFVPGVGLRYGCKFLAGLVAWAGGNVEQALSAYNGGKGGNTQAPYRNASYAAKVLAAKEKF